MKFTFSDDEFSWILYGTIDLIWIHCVSFAKGSANSYKNNHNCNITSVVNSILPDCDERTGCIVKEVALCLPCIFVLCVYGMVCNSNMIDKYIH